MSIQLHQNRAIAQTSISNINIPQSQWQQGQDKIRSADGTECARSVAPRDKWLEVGVAGGGIGGQGSDYGYPTVVSNGSAFETAPTGQYNRAGGIMYGKLVINLDKQPQQIDCNRLYESELERLKQELEIAKMGQANAKVYEPSVIKVK